ncbi:uncharacterized protein LOC143202299 [Rhynchophorus ferrugineus]|uniref:Pentraxin (PTX) domain-containing protein n=1 Tax=Rhynchophorus ferrugineus TaxID=354439 RepID=A0A834MBZ5_RHYFE|nr:hypothetical protein GWI33_008876 [Rhynchophorus ferrugineus]
MKIKFIRTQATFPIFLACLDVVFAVIHSNPSENLPPISDNVQLKQNIVTKASLTQKGYIQFLKYVVDVPEITDYTFCIWVKSYNFTHNHPLLSYSKHEEKRLIRVWISPHGTHLNLEILEIPVFRVPVNFKEHQWYHVCQSWSSEGARWELYLNGNLAAAGHEPQLKKVTIEDDGDLVVGQEYTDFDKGLDDGIEGDISGFNMVLAPTFSPHPQKISPPHLPPPNYLFKRNADSSKGMFQDPPFMNSHQMIAAMMAEKLEQIRKPKRQIWEESLAFLKEQQFSDPLPLEKDDGPSYKVLKERRLSQPHYLNKPLGLLLVQLSRDCGYLRGGPLSGKGVLVSWTKTNVRVFGGAIIKTAPPFCDPL